MPAAVTMKRRLEDGKCAYCGEREPIPGLQGCDPCLEAVYERQKARRDARVKAGICTRCTEPAAPCRTNCQKHLDYYNNRYHAKKRKKNARRITIPKNAQ